MWALVALFSLALAERDPGFTDWFTTELKTAEEVLLRFNGNVPSYVQGLLVQSGPGRFEMGNVSFGHALDGFSKVMRFKFQGANRVTYSTDFLQTDFYRESLEKGTIVEGMTAAETRPPTRAKYGLKNALGPNDNNYIKPQRVGSQEFMTSDTMVVTETDHDYAEVVNTIGPSVPGGVAKLKWDDDLTPPGHLCMQATMAHGKRDEKGGYMAAMGCQTMDGLPQYHVLFRIDPSQPNKRHLVAKLQLQRRPSYMHQNGETNSSNVIVATPLYMDLLGVMRGEGLAEGGLSTSLTDPTLFQVVSKADSSVHEFQTDGFLIGHVVNSYDDGKDIVVDVTYSSTRSGGFFKRFLLNNILDPVARDLFEKSTLMRYRLKGDGGVERSLTLPKEPAADIELPVIHPDKEGKHYCVLWGVQFSTGGRSFASTGVVKRNVCTGEGVTKYKKGMYVAEHRFIPDPASTEEDAGVLVGLVFNGRRRESFLEVLDAKTLDTLATAHLGMKVPFPVHTTWYPGTLDEILV